jgi:hypothetical protein
MFFNIYKLLLEQYQGARGVPLPGPILPVRSDPEREVPAVVVSELMRIYDYEEIKMPKLVSQVCLIPADSEDDPLFEELVY